jgi:hypothetical protein
LSLYQGITKREVHFLFWLLWSIVHLQSWQFTLDRSRISMTSFCLCCMFSASSAMPFFHSVRFFPVLLTWQASTHLCEPCPDMSLPLLL